MNHVIIKYRQCISEDIPEILRIQKTNVLSNLSKEDLGDGFLSIEFSPQQLEEINGEIPIIVADTGSQLGGYICGISLRLSDQFGLLAHIINRFEETYFRDRTLDQYRAFFYGPVCIEKHLRGGGVLEGLYGEFLRQLAGRFDVGVLFISEDNARSLHAHINKLGMEKISDIEFNGASLSLLAFDVPPLVENWGAGSR